MITIENSLDKKIDTRRFLGLNPEECVFFDIETTGFSASGSQLYLIGVVYLKNDTWQSLQWFADTFHSEEEVLSAFLTFIKDYSYLISFNGDGFDIPYLSKKALMFDIENTIPHLCSVDIFKAVKLFKSLLSLENYKQKSIERFLDLKREDQYNGGELIEVYQQYLRNGSDELYHLLILHNAEDIAGMPDILPIMAYGRLTDTSSCGINVPDMIIKEVQCDTQNEELIVHFESDITFPKARRFSTRTRFLQVCENEICLRLRMLQGELKHFFPNYKDYYYLPREDMALHKSVSQFVDKEFREKAKAANCYVRATGLFLPQCSEAIEPVFCKEYKDKDTYFPYNEEFAGNTALVERYVRGMIAEMIK